MARRLIARTWVAGVTSILLAEIQFCVANVENDNHEKRFRPTAFERETGFLFISAGTFVIAILAGGLYLVLFYILNFISVQDTLSLEMQGKRTFIPKIILKRYLKAASVDEDESSEDDDDDDLSESSFTLADDEVVLKDTENLTLIDEDVQELAHEGPKD